MMRLQAEVLGYLLNCLWQVPLIAAAAALIAAIGGRVSPLRAAILKHRVWVGALIAEVILPGCSVSLPRILLRGGSGIEGGAQIVMTGGSRPGLQLSQWVLATCVGLYLALIFYYAIRLVYGLVKTNRQVARAERSALNLPGSPQVLVMESADVTGPVTMGIVRPVLLLPVGFLDGICADDRAALFAHEAAHIRRHDFALNVLYAAMATPVAFHPGLWFTRARLAEMREMACDAMAAGSLAGAESYTCSLLRLAALLAPQRAASTLHAIGLLDANSFERRLMHLTELSAKPILMSRMRRSVLGCACAVLAVATCASAMALRMPAPVPAGQAHLSGNEQAMRIVHRQMPVYPAEAKANHDTLDGPVVLHVLIGKDGTVEDISVKQSLREDYDKSALDAVSQWRWTPYVLDGVPTEVDTEVTVTYSIDHSQENK